MVPPRILYMNKFSRDVIFAFFTGIQILKIFKTITMHNYGAQGLITNDPHKYNHKLGLSDSGNFSIMIVRTPLFTIVNSITIVDFVQVYQFIDS